MAASAGGVIAYFVRHRTAANLLLVVLMVLGLVAAPQMRTQYFPDVVFEAIRVTVTWEGAGPEDVDEGIVGPLMPALQAVDGVSETEAQAQDGRAQISLQFEPGWDMSRAQADVETAVNGVSDLPEDADTPEISQRAWRDRVTDVVISGAVSVDQLARFADDFLQRLFEAGVTRTTVRGIADPLTTVEVPTAALIRHDVSLAEIAQVIANEADTRPAGEIDAANARLRSGSARRAPEDIAAIALRTFPDGTVLSVGDIARIAPGGVDRHIAYFVGDRPALSIRVDRAAGGDAISLQGVVEEVAAQAMAGLPPEVSIDLIRTRSESISARLRLLLANGAQGLAMVVVLLFLFLNARTALWVAAGIPVAMLTAVAAMYAMGLSLNMISLFGLIITLGIVVDDAIVVGEHADWRARHLGEAPVTAAERAARRMALPVFTATITTIIAFWGVATIDGNMGQMIRDVPVTVIAVLAASMVECFLILPNHMAHALAHSARAHWYDAPSRVVNRGFRWFRRVLFRPFIALVIRARYPVLAAAVAVLATQAVLYISGQVRWQFFNSPEQPSISGNFAMAPGATRADSADQMRELQRATEAVAARYEAAHGLNPLAYVLTQIGGGTGSGLSGSATKDPDLLGSIAIELIDPDLRPYSSFDFVAAVQEEMQILPLAETVSFRGWRSGPGGNALDVRLYGAGTQRLKEAAEALKRAVAVFPEVSAVEDSMAWDKEELRLDLTAQARALGFDIADIGRVLRQRLNGIEAASFAAGPRSGSIRVEVPDSEKTADFLDRVLIRSPDGGYVPLADLVTFERQPGFSTIRRQNGLRTISVTGDINQDDPARSSIIIQEIEQDILPRIEAEYQVNWELGGLALEEEEFLAAASTGFILCLLGIYLTLAWIFASWARPLAIMAIIPFGLVGTIWGHYVWDVPMTMFTLVGLMGMTGIIINDSIVLITTVDDYARSRGLVPAIIDAVCDRLRPVLLTTLTTILGLGPLLYETSQQAQFLKPTVITLVYGLGFGVVMVLVVLPALLAAGMDISASLRAARRALGSRRAAGGHRAALALGAVLALWFAATLGAQVVLGRMPGLGALMPGQGTAIAFALFAIGSVAATLVALSLALAGALLGQRR
ncbi:MAG: efflux RND transporter permease subunit [Qingshengfaniella sp.]